MCKEIWSYPVCCEIKRYCGRLETSEYRHSFRPYFLRELFSFSQCQCLNHNIVYISLFVCPACACSIDSEYFSLVLKCIILDWYDNGLQFIETF